MVRRYNGGDFFYPSSSMLQAPFQPFILKNRLKTFQNLFLNSALKKCSRELCEGLYTFHLLSLYLKISTILNYIFIKDHKYKQ